VKYLEKRDQCPAVIFCFSMSKCEEAAYNLGKTDLSEGSAQKAQVHMLFEKALAQLNDPDRELPQILRVRDMLKRGIGVHHAGLLPIVKEVYSQLIFLCPASFALPLVNLRIDSKGLNPVVCSKGCGDPLPGGRCEYPLCNGDVCNGRQHACEDSCFYCTSEA